MRARFRSRLVTEFLEDRVVPATVLWDGGPSGTGTDWNAPANWANDTSPGADDDAVIGPAFAAQTVRVSSTSAARSVSSQARLSLSPGVTLTTPAVWMGNDFLLNSGTLAGAVVTFAAGWKLVGVSGTLAGATVNGDVDVSSGAVTVTGGLTLNGTATLGSASNTYGMIRFVGSQTLGGTGTVRFVSYGFYQEGIGGGRYIPNVLVVTSTADTLTIGPGITVDATGPSAQGTVGYAQEEYPLFSPPTPVGARGHVVNQGRLAGVAVDAADVLNTGTLDAVTVKAPLTSSGSLVAPAGKALYLYQGLTLLPGSRIDAPGILGLLNAGSASDPVRLEVLSDDRGLTPVGFGTPYLIGTLFLSNSWVRLADTSDDSPGTGNEALYLDTFQSYGSTLDLAGLHAYARAATSLGTVTGGAVGLLADLVVSSVSLSATGTPGQPATLGWTVRNQSGVAVTGDWQDALYLSLDTIPDPGDRLVAVVPRSGPLDPGASYTGTATVDLPAGLAPGTYYLLVDADRRGEVDNGRFVTNNTRASGSRMMVTVPTLVPGAASAGSFDHAGATRYFRVVVPEGGPTLALTLDTASGSGASEIAIRRGRPPEPGVADFRTPAAGAGPTLVAPDLPAGEYFVAVTRRAGATPENFTLTASFAGLSVTGLDLTTAANTGRVTVGIRGTRLSATATAALVGFGTTTPAAAVYATDGATLYATFDLTGLRPGDYVVRVTDGTVTADSPQALNVRPGTPGRVEASLAVTGAVRLTARPSANRDGVGTVRYVNIGMTDVPAPIFLLTATGGEIAAEGATDFAPAIQFLGVNRGGPAGVLPPGAEATFSFRFRPIGAANVDFELRQATDPNAVIDWAVLRDGSRPASVGVDAWAAVWANFTAAVGGTVGGLQTALGAAATRLGEMGESVTDVSRLLAFELQQAGAGAPFRALAGGTDAGVSAPGLALAFGRQFLQPLDARYRLGILGRGWTYTGDTTATADGDGNVTILSGGVARGFRSQGGTFAAAPGDHGTLTRAGGGYVLREPDGTVTTFLPDGRFDAVTDPHGNAVRAVYTGPRMSALVHSDGEQLQLAYTTQGRLASVTDPAGRVTTYGYDPTGEYLLSVTDAAGTTTYTYSDPATATPQQRYALRAVANPDGTHVYYDYDRAGRIVRVSRDGGTGETTLSYDGVGGVTVRDATGGRATLWLTDAGQVGLTRDALGREQRFAYDTDRNLVRVTAPLGTTFAFDYDAAGNVVRQVDPYGNVTTLTYDPAFNRLASLTDTRGNTTGYQYEADGDLRAIVYPDGGREQFGYDPLGNLTQATNRRNQTTRTTVDARGLTRRVDYADGTHTDFTYDSRGNLRTAADASGVTTLDYDAADRLTKITYPGGRFLRFDYDSGGRRAWSEDQDGFVVKYAYDAAGRLARLTDTADSLIVEYDYDPAGRLRREDKGNGTYTTYEYDTAGQLLHLVNHTPGGGVNSRFDYTYDALGRRTTETSLDGVTTYGYDAKGQLRSVTLPGGRVITYQYDTEGNRTSVTDAGATTAYTTNNLNQYTQVGSDAYTYDADGNLTKVVGPSGTTTYTYDSLNRLTGVTRPGETWAYGYDSLGNRTSATQNGQRTNYLIDPTGLGSIVGEYSSTGAILAHNVHGISLVSRIHSPGTYYYDFSPTSTFSGTTTSTGSYSGSASYLPFGELSASTGEPIQSFGFGGSVGAASYGQTLVNFRNRDYLPGVGRFTSVDSAGQGGGVNLYRYVSNNPVSFRDPSGQSRVEDNPIGMFILVHSGVYDYQKAHDEYNAAVTSYDAGNTSEANSHLIRGYQFSNRAALTTTRNVFLYDSYEAKGFAENPVEKIYTHGLEELAKGNLAGVFDIGDILFGNTTDALQSANFINTRQAAEHLQIPLSDGSAGTVYDERAARATSRTVTSYDPNDLIGPAGVGAKYWLPPTQTLPYTIRFENLPAASAPALEVTVTQTLDADLDWTTFRLGDIGFGSTTVHVPDGLQSYSASVAYQNTDGSPLRVDVVAGLDLATGVVTWTFGSVDPLTGLFPFDVFAGFLPPNDATGRGEGAISYTVRPKPGLATGTRLDAQARIVFDANAPIDTPAVFNTVDSDPPTSAVDPLPTTTPAPNIPVAWAGSDPGGSGVAAFTVYVSVDGGPFEMWLSNTTAMSAIYPGTVGHGYAFYTLATDLAGLVQPDPGPIGTVEVAAPAPPPPPDPKSGLGPVRPVAVGGATDGTVQLATTGRTLPTLAPFGNTGAATRTASADVDGDGVADLIAATGPGTPLRVAVLSGADGSVLVTPFDPFGGEFTGGGYVAAGDLDGDGKAEFAVTPDQGGGPRVTVFSLGAGGSRAVRANFFGIDDTNFRGGARAAVGDVNGDGTPDVVVAAGFGGGPRTAIFTGQSVLAGAPARLVNDFFAFPGTDATNLRNGSFVAAGDVTGDGFADLVFGGGPGGAPRVFVLSGAQVSAGQVDAAQASPMANFFVADDLTDRGGARVAVTNADGDTKADVAVGSGAGRPARVRLYLGKDFAGGGEPPAADLDVLGGAILADGVYVG